MKFLTLLLTFALLAACSSPTSDEQQVRELLASAENAAEARDTGDFLELIATDYSDSQGFDRAQLQNFLRAYFLAHPRIEVLTNVQELTLPVPGLARATVDVVVFPSGDRATFTVEFRREDGDWRVSRADRR